MESFHDRFVMNMNICNGCSNIVLNAGICNNKCRRRDVQRFKDYFVQFLDARFDIIANVLIKKMKIKIISISVNDSIIREKFWIDRIKRWENFVKVIFHIYNVTFDKIMLSSC